MTQYPTAQPEESTKATPRPSLTKRLLTVAGVAGLLGIAALLNFAVFDSVREQKAEHDAWGPRRVATHYGECLDARYGYQRTLLDSRPHDTTAVTRGLHSGTFTNQQVDAWLKEMQCPPLPEVAYQYRRGE